MRSNQTANEWMKQNGFYWTRAKRSPPGGNEKFSSSKRKRVKAAQSYREKNTANKQSIKQFVEANRYRNSTDCLFVPCSVEGRPARLEFCGKPITAARYMLLLTQGLPKWDHAFATHKCGNGHLSCVNPNCLKWGDPSTNASDAVLHRNCKSVEEKIEAVELKGL